jgi:uncharacterized protein YecE (DUF72 family)
MRVIDAEKLDTYLTDVIRKSWEAANLLYLRGEGRRAYEYDQLANTLRNMADEIAEMSQEGTIYLEPTTSDMSSDMSGPPQRTRISPLHTLE